jgi:hypothetical protein
VSYQFTTPWRWRQHSPPKRWYPTTSLIPWRWRQHSSRKSSCPTTSLHPEDGDNVDLRNVRIQYGVITQKTTHEPSSLSKPQFSHRLRVFENRVLKGIFRSKLEEVAGGWKRLHNEELHNLHATQSTVTVVKSRSIRGDGVCSTHGRDKKFLQYFGWKTWREETTWKT